jgi:uncharacterized protein (UPF0332 family)
MGELEDLLHSGRLKKATIASDIVRKEFRAARSDLDSSRVSLESGNTKWATIQAYFSIFHGARALIFQEGYREESHSAMKRALKILFVDCEKLPSSVLDTLERGMNLREIADYKEDFSEQSAHRLIQGVAEALEIIEPLIMR